MRRNKLGRTDIEVSDLCLGTMTFGEQTSKQDAFRQLDMASEHGINFLDTAEAYSTVPMRRETAGDSERIIGEWMQATGKRDAYIIATKIAGEGCRTVRGGEPIDGASLRLAAEDSLRKLQTDVIDVYQLHWPNRGSYHFRKYWHYDPSHQPRGATEDEVLDILTAANALIREGKIRTIALSNESAWGTMQFLQVAEENNLPRVVSIQNEYSMMCRVFDTDLAEMCHHEDVGLLSFSPLAAGLLTGKYQHDEVPEGSRRAVQHDLSGRINGRSIAAVAAYQDYAKSQGIDLAHMALAFVRARPFTATAIFGTTSSAQLEYLLAGKDLELSEGQMMEINRINRAHPMPF